MEIRSKYRFTAITALLILVVAAQGFGADAIVEETAISLDGTWHVQPADGDEREIAVPGFWERIPGLRNVHEATYTRAFDVPESFAGRRVLLRFDAVGDAADVSVNGQPAGGHVGACPPFEVDITGLVIIPSTGNRLAVAVRDDTHFSVPRQSSDRRNRKSWIPRGLRSHHRRRESFIWV